MTRVAPFLASIPKAIHHIDGRHIATIGSVDDDPDGNVVYQLAQEIALSAPVL